MPKPYILCINVQSKNLTTAKLSKTVGSTTDAMLDFTNTTFCVSVTDKFSLLSYAITSKIHWLGNIGQHSGIKTV